MTWLISKPSSDQLARIRFRVREIFFKFLCFEFRVIIYIYCKIAWREWGLLTWPNQYDQNRQTLLVWTWPNIDNNEHSLGEHDRKRLIFGHIHLLRFLFVVILILIFGQAQQVNVRRWQFSVMFTDFGHIHSVMLIILKRERQTS